MTSVLVRIVEGVMRDTQEGENKSTYRLLGEVLDLGGVKSTHCPALHNHNDFNEFAIGINGIDIANRNHCSRMWDCQYCTVRP